MLDAHGAHARARSKVDGCATPSSRKSCLTEFIYQLVLESQLPHKTVKFTFNYEQLVDDFVGTLTYTKRLHKPFL